MFAAFFGAIRTAYDRGYAAGLQSLTNPPIVLREYRVDDLVTTNNGQPDLEPLVLAIKARIDRESWTDTAGECWIHPFVGSPHLLAIAQTPGNHRRIERFLDEPTERKRY